MGYFRDRCKDPARKGKGRRWQVRYQVDGRERDGGSYDVKAVAQRKPTELEAAVHRGQWIDTTDRTTVAQACVAYAATRPLRRTARVEHRIRKRTRERVPPKTPRSRRTISPPTIVAEALAVRIRDFRRAVQTTAPEAATAQGRPG